MFCEGTGENILDRDIKIKGSLIADPSCGRMPISSVKWPINLAAAPR